MDHFPSPRRLILAAALLATASCGWRREGPVEVGLIGDAVPSLGAPVGSNPALGPLRLAMAQGLVRIDGSGQIEPGLAERWAVSDDGLSYLFRLSKGDWPDGSPIRARDVARRLRTALASRDPSGTVDAVGAIERVTAMTDHVLEIELVAPRPNLLWLLAQPQFALLSAKGEGSGPLHPAERSDGEPTKLRLEQLVPGTDGDPDSREHIDVHLMRASAALAAFKAEDLDAVLGGRIDDLPIAQAAGIDSALRFDPASGLFGLVPGRRDGIAADPEVRRLLNAAIDRQALLDAFAIPGLQPRTTLLQPGLDEITPSDPPGWAARPYAERLPSLRAAATRIVGRLRPVVTLDLPRGPGGRMILARIAADWAKIGIRVERAAPGQPADFRLVDEVAPSPSGAWFVRRFRCGETPICAQEIDEALASARTTIAPEQRALFLSQAARRIDDLHLFLPIAAPVRWSAVGPRMVGFQTNPFALHPLGKLDKAPARPN